VAVAELLERESERDAIGAALRRAEDGQGTFQLIGAAAGMGKTSLLRAAADSAKAEGFVYLRARDSELEHGFAYGCVRQLIEPAMASTSDAATQACRAKRRASVSSSRASLPSAAARATPPPRPPRSTRRRWLATVWWPSTTSTAPGRSVTS